MVFRMIGSSEYSTSAATLGTTPRPNSGISSPSSAKDGMVRMTLEVAVARLAASALR